MKIIIDIVQAGGTFDDILPFSNLTHTLIFLLVILVMNLPDNLLKDILQRDKTGHIAILVQNNGNIKCRFTHLHQQLGNTFIFIGKMRFPHDISDLEILIAVIEKQILHIDDTDNVILAALVNRKAGKLVLPKDLDQFLVCIIDFRKCNMNHGNHNILRLGVAQVEHIVDHFLFFRLNNAVLMTHIHDRPKLILCHGLVHCCRIHAKQKHDRPAKKIENKDHRGHYRHKRADDHNIPKCDLFGIDRGIILRRNLAEYKNRKGKHRGSDTHHIAAKHIRQRCRDGGCRKIHDIIADKNST